MLKGEQTADQRVAIDELIDYEWRWQLNSWTADRVTLNHTKDSCWQSIIRRESLNNTSRFFECCYCWTPTYYKRLCYITTCIISHNLSNIPSFSFTCRLNYRFEFEILIKFYISVWGFILYDGMKPASVVKVKPQKWLTNKRWLICCDARTVSVRLGETSARP